MGRITHVFNAFGAHHQRNRCLVVCHNGLVSGKTKVDEAWSGTGVQLKRRHELVPNPVNSIRSAMAHERNVLDRILEARTHALNALAGRDHDKTKEAETNLTTQLQRFVGYTEDNPEITATETVRLLQQQLEETEDQIAASHRLFKGSFRPRSGCEPGEQNKAVAEIRRRRCATR